MKYIDAEKFNEVLLNLEEEMKPKEASFYENPISLAYWKAISVTLFTIRKAVELASEEFPEQ